jgi:uncharacterized protein YggU (UPF0235/DUF167 family)
MKIFVKAKTKAKENKVTPPKPRLFGSGEKIDALYTVQTKSQPIQGKANDSIIELLAEHFAVTKSQVRLVSGASSKTKVFDILV